jgi:hypothetical protein
MPYCAVDVSARVIFATMAGPAPGAADRRGAVTGRPSGPLLAARPHPTGWNGARPTSPPSRSNTTTSSALPEADSARAAVSQA